MAGKDGRVRFVRLGLFLVAVIFAMLAPRLDNVAVPERWASDLKVTGLTPQTEQSTDIVILTITEETLEKFRYRSPVNRGYLTSLLKRLARAKPRIVGVDVLFDQPTDPKMDKAFQETVKSVPFPVVAGWTDVQTGMTEKQYAFQKMYLRGIHAGFSNQIKDTGGTVREIFPGRMEVDGWRPGFAAVIASLLGVKDLPREPIRLAYRALNDDLNVPPFPRFPSHVATALPDTFFTGKVVLIGADLPFKDRHRTPFAAAFDSLEGMRPGVEIMANVISQYLEGRTDKGTNPFLELVIAIGLCFIGIALPYLDHSWSVKLLAGGGTLIAFLAANLILFAEAGLDLPIVLPTIAFGAAMGLGSAHAAKLQRDETQYVSDAFSRYLAPEVVEKLRADPEEMALGGRKRDVTLLFTDVAGFTTMSERLEPTQLVQILNQYLDELCACIIKEGGLVDKFIGDAVMAIFGAPDTVPDHAERAVRCALAMHEISERFAAEQEEDGVLFGRTRIGVHTGEAVVGNIGGSDRFSYTAIGDTVNSAARLEGANKYFGTWVCISRETEARLSDALPCRPIGNILVKGRAEGVQTFEPLNRLNSVQAADYMAAYDLMRQGDKMAPEKFAAYLRAYPDDALAKFHADRLQVGEISEFIVLEGK